MSFHLHRKEHVRAGLARVAALRVRRAVGLTRGASGRDPESVHQVRVTIKRLRAMWRLVRPATDAGLHGAQNARLRDAARLLSARRDDLVVAAAIRKLRKNAGKPDRKAIDALEHRLTRPDGGKPQPPWREVTAALRATAAAWRRLPRIKDEWEWIGPGLRRSYRRAAERAAQARSKPADAAFHEWRKTVKDLQYQLELLERAWPKRIGGLLDELRALSRLLGTDHDLTVSAQRITPLPRSVKPRAQARRSLALMRREQRRLRADALRKGRSLFTQTPDAFVAEIAARWQDWRA